MYRWREYLHVELSIYLGMYSLLRLRFGQLLH